jgi:hypothetical protein
LATKDSFGNSLLRKGAHKPILEYGCCPFLRLLKTHLRVSFMAACCIHSRCLAVVSLEYRTTATTTTAAAAAATTATSSKMGRSKTPLSLNNNNNNNNNKNNHWHNSPPRAKAFLTVIKQRTVKSIVAKVITWHSFNAGHPPLVCRYRSVFTAISHSLNQHFTYNT